MADRKNYKNTVQYEVIKLIKNRSQINRSATVQISPIFDRQILPLHNLRTRPNSAFAYKKISNNSIKKMVSYHNKTLSQSIESNEGQLTRLNQRIMQNFNRCEKEGINSNHFNMFWQDQSLGSTIKNQQNNGKICQRSINLKNLYQKTNKIKSFQYFVANKRKIEMKRRKNKIQINDSINSKKKIGQPIQVQGLKKSVQTKQIGNDFHRSRGNKQPYKQAFKKYMAQFTDNVQYQQGQILQYHSQLDSLRNTNSSKKLQKFEQILKPQQILYKKYNRNYINNNSIYNNRSSIQKYNRIHLQKRNNDKLQGWNHRQQQNDIISIRID